MELGDKKWDIREIVQIFGRKEYFIIEMAEIVNQCGAAQWCSGSFAAWPATFPQHFVFYPS